jgi:signal transduction histidine kinase
MHLPNSRPADDSANFQPIFRLLVLYRWAGLVLPLFFLIIGGSGPAPRQSLIFLAAVASNLLITLRPAQLNRVVQRWPHVLAVDLIFNTVLLAATGYTRSPYTLYSFSPLLAAAFFFQVPGALLAAGTLSGLFVASLWPFRPTPDWLMVTTQCAGYFIIAGVFGYQPVLLERLRTARDDLARAHRDLEIIHQLTLSLQSAADVNEVEERVLEAITGDLGFSQAVVALVDQNDPVMTSWLGKAHGGKPVFAGGLPHPARVPLTAGAGVIAEALLNGRARLSCVGQFTSDGPINNSLGPGPYHIFPMLLREHPVGVLLVDASEAVDPARQSSLQAIASQASVAVGTTLLCIDRAQRLAVQDERVRIAREIHDTVSQSLFGITYSLDACVKLLPESPSTVKEELAHLLSLAQATREEVRQSILDIWPSELTAQQFSNDLRRYVTEACRANPLEADITVRGDFGAVPARAKRSLYRIAQEALTNVVRHAEATQARVCVEVTADQAMLAVSDNGHGFDPQMALGREFSREHFGLRGIADRVQSLNGTTEILSALNSGSKVLVTIPVFSKSDDKSRD